MERLGLGPDALIAANPKLVYGRVTGWGQDGPLAQEAGHDINYIAHQRAAPRHRPEGAAGGADQLPRRLCRRRDDAGVRHGRGAARRRSAAGKGQVIDAAMSDGAALIGALTYGLRAAGAWRDEREANLLDGGDPTYGVYRCLDGKFLALGAIEPQFRASLFKGLALRAGRQPRGDRGGDRDAQPRRMGGAFRRHRRLRRAGARPRRSAGPSAQYRAAHLHRPRRRVPAGARAALFGHAARPARPAAARGAGWRGDPRPSLAMAPTRSNRILA